MPGMPALPWGLALFCPLTSLTARIDLIPLFTPARFRHDGPTWRPSRVSVVEGARLESDFGDLH